MALNRETGNKGLYLGLLSLILGCEFVYLFFEEYIALNFTLYIASIVLVGLLLSRKFLKSLRNDQYILLALTLFFSGMVYVRASDLLTFFNVVGSLLLGLLAIYIFTGTQLRNNVFADYIKTLFLPALFAVSFFETLPFVVTLKNVSIKDSKTREVIRGTIMAVIAVTLFTWLFSYADITFAKLLSNIFVFEFTDETFAKIIMATIVTAFFIGTFGFIFHSVHVPVVVKEKIRNVGHTEITILLGSIVILFFVFIALQISYFFGGLTHLVTEGLTYAEFARKGFSQLVTVAAVSLVIITMVENRVMQGDASHVKSFKVLSSILVLEVIAILVSAFQKLYLYESAYGFTTIRLYSYALMIWLAVAMALLGYHIWRSNKQSEFVFKLFVSVCALLFAMNVLNPDVFIAKKNLERYETTGKVDAVYLASLSDDALPYTIHLLDAEDEKIRTEFSNALFLKDNYCTLDVCTDQSDYGTWRSSHVSTARADALMVEYKDKIKKPEYANEVD